MTMDASAINAIQQSSTVRELNSLRNTDHPMIVIPDNMKIADMEQYQSERNNYRGRFICRSIAAFGEYAHEHNTESTCYINSADMTATIIFDQGDEGAPGHCLHRAEIKAQKTPDLSPSCTSTNARSTSAIWPSLSKTGATKSSATAMPTAKSRCQSPRALNSIRNMTERASVDSSHSESDYSASASRMAKIEASSDHGTIAGFLFTCQPYHELPDITFFVRLSYLTGQEKPVWMPRIRRLQTRELEIAESFQSEIQTAINGTDITTILGIFDPS